MMTKLLLATSILVIVVNLNTINTVPPTLDPMRLDIGNIYEWYKNPLTNYVSSAAVLVKFFS